MKLFSKVLGAIAYVVVGIACILGMVLLGVIIYASVITQSWIPLIIVAVGFVGILIYAYTQK